MQLNNNNYEKYKSKFNTLLDQFISEAVLFCGENKQLAEIYKKVMKEYGQNKNDVRFKRKTLLLIFDDKDSQI